MRRTNRSILLLLVALVVVVSGCSGNSPVKVHPTPGTDFSKYQTYAIRPGNVVYPGASEAERGGIEQLVQDTIGASLESRGLAPQPDEPDLVVTYTLGARATGGFGSGARPPVGQDAREPSGNPYDEPGYVRAPEFPDAAADAEMRAGNVRGNVVIDLLDGKSRRLVWRATADVDMAPSRRARAIRSVVERAFAEVPTLRATAAPRPATAPSSPHAGAERSAAPDQ